MTTQKEKREIKEKLKEIRKQISQQKSELAKIQENIFLAEAIADRMKEILDEKF